MIAEGDIDPTTMIGTPFRGRLSAVLLFALVACSRGDRGVLDASTGDGGLSPAFDAASGRPGSLPGDYDGDGIPDERDNDADNDGLSNEEETTRYFTNPLNEDTDGDGFSDAAEVASGHDPNDAAVGPSPDDYYLILPRGAPSQERDLRFSTTLRKADVFFMMDRTGSMGDEARNLREGVRNLARDLEVSIPDVGIGFGGFSGFLVGNCRNLPFVGMACDYGADTDNPFSLISTISTDIDAVTESVGGLRADEGGLTWAPSTEAVYQAATGEGFAPWVPPQSCPSGGPDDPTTGIGYPCFRPGALPVMVVLTDTSCRAGWGVTGDGAYDLAEFGSSPPHTYEEAVAAANAIGARVFGVVSGSEVDEPTAREQMEQIARDTGAVNADGTPIVFTISSNGSGLTGRVADAIAALASDTPQHISTRVRDGADFPAVPAPGVDARQFVKAITPLAAFRDGVEIGPDVIPRDDRRFDRVTPGTEVVFRVRFQNDSIDARATSQIYRATIVVLGNGVADLDSREVIILVPAGSVLL